MSQKRFNLVQSIEIIITVIGIIIVVASLWSVFKKRRIFAVISIFCFSVLGLALSIFLGMGLVFKERTMEGTVISISDKALPVFMGPDRAYEIYLDVETEQKELSLSTDAFSSKELKRTVSMLKPGDKIRVKYNRWYDLYYCELLNEP